MLARLKLILDSRLEYYQSSNLQGVLMQNIDTDYAEYLHNQRFNPYSIAVGHEDGNTVWTITTVTKEAYQQIIEPLKSDSFREFDIHKHQLHVRIIDKKLTAVSREALLQSVGRKNGIIFRFTMKPRHHLNQMEDMLLCRISG